MAVPNNILQQVITYQMSELAYLQNLNCFIHTANTRFKDFEKMTGNLGDTVSFDLPPRMTTASSLVAVFQSAQQRIQNLVCGNAISASVEFTSQQFIFNVEEYMAKFGKAGVEEMGAKIEADVASVCVTNTYRFFGDGVNPINSFTQLANALALFRNYGSARGKAKGYIGDTVVPNIIGSGLNQFAMNRNNEIANSWELGDFTNCEWYQSNLLPVHIAGTAGNNALTLTVVSFTQNGPNGSIDTITFSISGAPGADANMIKQYDKLQFNDGVAGQPNMRYLTFIGHLPSNNPVQFRAQLDAASTGGSQVTVSVFPFLQAAQTNDQNLNNQVAVGMQVSVLPSHRAGMITAGDPFFLAMPQLPDQSPFYTANARDMETGVSMRLTYGTIFGQNQMGLIHDAIWGKTLVDEYAMALIFPL